MTAIPAGLVKELREATGAGMMDCKRALEETGGDVDSARTLLRERGMAQAGMRAGRDTTEGRVLTRVSAEAGTIVAVGCETEPVSKSEDFLAFAGRALDAVAQGGAEALEGLEHERVALVARLGENIVVRGDRLQAGAGELLAEYVHPPANKIGVLVRTRGGSAETARRVAMHISFAAPAWRARDDVPAGDIEAERQIYLNSHELEGKPEQARDRIVEGMLNKRFFAQQPGGVLVDQPWIHEPAQSVGQALGGEGVEVLEFRRLSVSG